MNHLAHLYLSGNDPLVITGNFMGDAVKGSDLGAYAAGLQRGIRLHRAIDSFTDQHEITRQGRARLRAHTGRYAGVVLDLFYDHLLASDWQAHHAEPLPQFSQRMYALLQQRIALMPVRITHMLPYMVAGDWLRNYAHIDGLAGALHGLSQRARQGGAMLGAERVLVAHREVFRLEFAAFFADLRLHVKQQEE